MTRRSGWLDVRAEHSNVGASRIQWGPKNMLFDNPDAFSPLVFVAVRAASTKIQWVESASSGAFGVVDET